MRPTARVTDGAVALTGWRISNLPRSLRMMAGYGLVKFKREGRTGHGVGSVATEFLGMLDDPAHA
ncbi:MAG: hypothetical protein LBI92_09645 [Azoarcus sp.]|nr:hypothetical protein [Azoarcus sp.]